MIQWVVNRFGADDIQSRYEDVGVAHPSIWRPGLYTYKELQQGLRYTSFENEDEDQALFLLFQKMIAIFSYIGPADRNLCCYGHRLRALIILASTEFENQCRHILSANHISPKGNDYISKDFVKLNIPAHLTDYEVKFKPYADLYSFRPFDHWNENQPTKSLKWYDKYNRVKHDRGNDFVDASLETSLNAIASNIILYAIRFGSYLLFNFPSVLLGYFNQYGSLSLVNPDIRSFYIPKVKTVNDMRKDCFTCDALDAGLIELWKALTVHIS